MSVILQMFCQTEKSTLAQIVIVIAPVEVA